MFKYLINFISQSLEFSKSEAKGTLGLIFIILVSLITSQLSISYSKKVQDMKNPTEKAELEKWVSTVRASIHPKKIKEATPNPTKESYKVDPEKTGNAEKTKNRSFVPKETERKIVEKIEVKDLNTATKEELRSIRGIGPAFSERIVKYRNLLGGFASIRQLSEVYGLQDEVIEELVKYYEISSPPTPLNINTDSVKVLATHPYISYDLAWTIYNYRKQNGDIRSAEDFKKIKSVDAETLEKLIPYLQ